MQAPEEASNQRAGFWKIASAGAAFQAGSAAVDSTTIMSAHSGVIRPVIPI